MACTRTKHTLHVRSEAIRQFQGNIGLGRSGKAATMHPAGTPAVQRFFTPRQGQRHGLLGRRAQRRDILQKAPGGQARGVNQLQISGKVSLQKGLALDAAIRAVLASRDAEGPVAFLVSGLEDASLIVKS